jgi:hypothetical protein
MSETKIIVLGTVSIEPGEVVHFDIPPDASAAEITAAILRANAEKAAAQVAETKKLRELFPIEGKPHE